MKFLSNCWIWALCRFVRGYWRGEALVIRKSSYHWVPHMMIAQCVRGLEIIEYTSLQPPTGWRRILPIHVVLYRGRVREGEARCVCERCQSADELR